MTQKYNDNMKRPQSYDTQLGILKIYAFCQKIQQSASGPEESAAGVTQYLFEKTPKIVVVQGRVQLEHSSHIVNVGVEATFLHFNPWPILKETTEPTSPFGTMSQEH